MPSTIFGFSAISRSNHKLPFYTSLSLNLEGTTSLSMLVIMSFVRLFFLRKIQNHLLQPEILLLTLLLFLLLVLSLAYYFLCTTIKTLYINSIDPYLIAIHLIWPKRFRSVLLHLFELNVTLYIGANFCRFSFALDLPYANWVSIHQMLYVLKYT